MSVARGFGLNSKSIYMNVGWPKVVKCNFIVDSANGNGLGIRSLKSNGYINNIFMHTTASAGTNNGYTNPNPAAGFAMIQFKNNFKTYLGGMFGFVSPLAGGPSNNTTANKVYTIVTLGTTTLAQWIAAGFPLGFTPAVGATFVASATGAIGGTGTVALSSFSGISSIEVLGNSNLLLNNSNIAQNGGAQLFIQFLAPTAAGNTTPVATAPADGQVVALDFWFDASTVTVDGI